MVGKEFFEAVFELVGTDYISLSFLLLSDGLAGHLPPSKSFDAVNCMRYPDECENYFGQRRDWLGNSMSCLMRHRRSGKGIPDEEHFLQERVSDKEIFPVER